MEGGAKTKSVPAKPQPRVYLPLQQKGFFNRPPIRPPTLLQAFATKQAFGPAARIFTDERGRQVSPDILEAIARSQSNGIAESVFNDPEIRKLREGFFGKVLGPNIRPNERGETIKAIEKLAFFDSIHDFWPERGRKKKVEGEAEAQVKVVTGEDEDEPIEMDPKVRIDTVHNKLVESIRNYLNVKDVVGIEAILQGTTNGVVSSPSGIEDKVLAYFSKVFSPFNQKEVTITVKDILAKWKYEDFESKWNAYRMAILKLPDYITISIDGTFIKSLDTAELGHVGFFILAFMNPNINPGQSNPNLTFDMLPGDVGRIFERFKQVRNGIYPQNVADSATTSFTALLGRAQYFRADYSPAGVAKEVRQVARSNAFTRDKYEIVFVDKGFGPKNKFGFYVEIRDKETKEIVATIPFGGGKEQGPSVNYLMDLLNGLTNPPKKDSIATFSGLREIDPDLLFDVKRLGDQEQMLATTSYGITGDRFAGAFRRLLRMPGIYHSSKGLRVWRGRSTVSEADLAKQAREFRKAKVVEKLKIVSGIIKAGDILDKLLWMKAQCEEAMIKGTVFYKEDGFQYGGKLTPEFIYENYTRIAERFATYILRIRMEDIVTYIDKLVATVSEFQANIPAYDEAACEIGEPKPSNPVEPCPPQVGEPTDDVIDAALDKLEEFLDSVDELKKLNIAFVSITTDGDEDVEPIDTFLFNKDDARLIKGITSTIFNFSAGPFYHPDTGITTAVAKILQVASSASNLETMSPQINKLLVQYFQARDEIKEAFFNEDLKDQVEAATDISSGEDMTPTRIVTAGADGRQGLLEVLENLAAVFEGREVPVAPPAEGFVGGADDNPPSPLQYRDLHDLFAKLCIEAQVTIERLDYKYDFDIRNGVPEADATNASMIEVVAALNEIETKWVTEVEQLRVHAEDDYGAPFEESATTDLITFLLSFRTNADGTGATYDSLFRIRQEEVERRDMVSLNDIGGILLQNLPVEPFMLKILATVGSDILSLANSNEISNTYAAPAKWRDELPNALYVATAPSAEALALVRGGGLEGETDTLPNADGSSTGSSRRRLFAGLRKRSGAGTPPELRE